MFIHPLLSAILAPKYPKVSVLDVREDTSDLTTYTFTACNLGDLGGGGTIIDGNSLGANTTSFRMPSRKQIVVIVHGKDALATFSVSSCTIGGVSGTERVDRGGGTNAINTAIYVFPTATLDAITNTDIAVTFSEAVTGCAIGVLLMENIGQLYNVATANATGAANIDVGLSTNLMDGQHHCIIVGSTCITGGGTERVNFSVLSLNAGTPCFEPVVLYEGSNAEFDYAAAYTVNPSKTSLAAGTVAGMRVTWSGTGAGDAVLIAHG